MLSKIKENVYKISGMSNCYYLKNYKIMIDTGSIEDREVVKKNFVKVASLTDVKKVIFTHLHYDHIFNFDLFPKAKLYASPKEMSDLKKDPEGTVLNKDVLNKFKKTKLIGLTRNHIPKELKIIKTPGHTSGSISLYDKKTKVLFSGDTLFYNLVIGRYDLPTSSPKDMYKSLEKLSKLDVSVLCPGHNY